MHKTLLAIATILPMSVATLPAQAFVVTPAPDVAPSITLVAGGCGFGFHRGPLGGCRANGGDVFVGGPGFRRCPPGFHLGPYGRACRPNL